MTTAEIAQLALLGGVVALDGTSVGQFMLSRPLVCGILAGSILGDVGQGLLVGGVLELFHIMIFPIGGGRGPEAGPATVVAVAAAGMAPMGATAAGALASGVAFGVVWSHVGGVSVSFQRRLNGRLAPEPSAGGLSPGGVALGHISAMAVDFCRGGLLTLVGIGFGMLGGPLLARSWPLDEAATLAVLMVAAAVPLGILLRSFGGLRRRGVLFAAGFLAGMAGAVLL